MRHNFTICTPQLMLRQMLEEDIPLTLQWRNHPDIKKWFFYEDISEEDQKKWYQSYLENEKDLHFIIEETQDLRVPIGTVGLYNINPLQRTADFGRFLIGDFRARGKGLGFESAQLVCKFAFHQLPINVIRLEVFEDNKNAKKIYEKLGFIPLHKYNKGDRVVIRMFLYR